MEVLRLFPAVQQFQVKNGAINTDGRLYVYFNGTDDLADCFDVDGSRIAQPVILDNNGRAPGLFVDASKVYRLEVQDRYGNLLFTVRNMVPTGGGAGSALGKDYDVVSLDGSIAVDKSVDAGNTTFDLSIAPSDSVEFLEWGAAMRGNMHEGGDKPATLTSGTMEMGEKGPKLLKDHYYHITNWMTVIPSGTGRNYETLTVTLNATDGTGWHSILIRDFDIDTSVSDSVTHEFSLDFLATEDCEIFWELSENVPDIGTVDYLGMNIHRIYSGINAVPGTCATKQWVSESFQPLSGMSSYVPYSAVGNNNIGQVTGINGSAIAGSLDSATVSSIASSVASAYTESAFSSISSWTADFSSISSKADSSSLSAYQPVSAMSGYATEAYVDAKVGDKLDATASSLFLTGLPDDLATTVDIASAVSGKLDKSASGEFYPMTGNPSGFLTAHQSLAGLATETYVDSSVSSKLDTSAFASASAGFQPSGNYAYNSSLSAYIPVSASGAFAPSGNYQSAGDYAFNSAVSSKLDASASSNFVVNSSMTSWIPYSALDYSGTAISGIGGSSLAGMGGGSGADYTGVYPVNVDNTAREISVDSLPLVTDSSMTAYGSAGSSVIGVNLDIMSGKLDSSAQVVTATATRLYAGMDFLTGINGTPVSASRAGNAANASFANSAWYDGTGRLISSLPDSATVSAIASAYATGKQDTLAFAYNTANQISSINGSALGGMDEAAVSGIASAYAQSAASSKLDKTAFNSGDFYLTSNPSGFITGVDLTPYQPTSAMSAYATTAYVTSGLSGKENVFSAGTGLEFVQSGSDRVLQVEAPVDIVAGPGIVIDNPDGNTLRVSCDSAYETLLWSGFSSTTTTATTYNLSENIRNFRKFKILSSPNDQTLSTFQHPMQEFVFNLENNSENGAIYAQFPTYSIGANTLMVNYWYLSGGAGVCTSLGLLPGVRQVNGTVSTGVTAYSGSICQIWGINRTASN